MRTTALLLAAAAASLGACGEPIRDDHFANDTGPVAVPPPAPMQADARPVRIGELGPNFDACAAAGTTRRIAPGATLAVRAAPFDAAAETGAVREGGRFFICSRSLDQKWFGIVYDEGGTLAGSCGVAAPAAQRRDYDGPCKSGWVNGASVKFIAGEAPATPQAAAPAAEGVNTQVSN
jgi:hypothetical protein